MMRLPCRNLSSITQAGLVNNLNDGMVWGLLPVLLNANGYGLQEIGIVVSVYPAIWGIGQLFTGKLADKFPKKTLLFWGMLMQGVAIVVMGYAVEIYHYILTSILLDLGTAIVYPAFLAAIANYTNPEQRAESIGVFRLWRDSGYVFGAILSGVISDAFGIGAAVISIGVLTTLSALLIKFRMS